MRSIVGPVLLMLGTFTALEISENTTGQDAEPSQRREGSLVPISIERLNPPGIETLHKLTPSLYSGSHPVDPSGYESLAHLGIKTIINVDGAAADPSSASRLQILAVHLPLSYVGIDAAQSARLIKAARTLPNPIYVECRTGQDRSAAAAAIIAMGNEGWNLQDGLLWLKTVGTSRLHRGLYRSVKSFQIPSKAALTVVPDDWPESVKIPASTQAMLDIERCWQKLNGSPNPAAARELVECYRKLVHPSRSSEAFEKRLIQATAHAQDLATRLEQTSRPLNPYDREILLERTSRDCKTCHEAHRD